MSSESPRNDSMPPDRLGFAADARMTDAGRKRRSKTLRSLLCWAFGLGIGISAIYYVKWIRPTLAGVTIAYDVFVFLAVFTLMTSLSLHILSLHDEG